MTKIEFIEKYNTCFSVSNQLFNKVGLIAKRCCNKYKEGFDDLSLEELYIRYEFAIKEGESFKRDANQQVIIKADSEKEFNTNFRNWKNEPYSYEIKFTPIVFEEKFIKMIPPSIFDVLNGFLFDISEEEYLSIIEKPEK